MNFVLFLRLNSSGKRRDEFTEDAIMMQSEGDANISEKKRVWI